MSEKKNRNITAIGLGVLSVILVVILILMAFNYIPIMNNTKDNADLINVGMGALDKGHGVMHIQGYVVNAGVSTAYETNIHVVANYVSGTKAIDTFVKINNGMMTSKSSVQIDLDVFYTANSVGVAASTATITPTWFNSQP